MDFGGFRWNSDVFSWNFGRFLVIFGGSYWILVDFGGFLAEFG